MHDFRELPTQNSSSKCTSARDLPNQAEAITERFNYSFDHLYLEDQCYADSFGIEAYPTTLVVDKSSHIIFKGRLDDLVSKIESILKPN